MPLQNTSGNDTTDAYGGGAAVIPNYIEDVFSTWLYQADGSSTQTINNGIDLSGKGGLVWIKSRSNATNNAIFDTVRGFPNEINSNTTGSQYTATGEIGSATSTGFTVPYNTIYGDTNYQTRTYASWTFRKQPKFFDVVTYTGTGSNRTIAHNLGSVPGCIIVKRTDLGLNWQVYHSSLANTDFLILNTNDPSQTNANLWNSTTPTSASFTVGTSGNVNASGGTYVAYLFASNAGGFGLTGTDNVVSCGAFTTDGSGNASVTLGYEPQYVMIKRTDAIGTWFIVDIMRGFSNTQFQYIQANTTAAENSSNASPSYVTPNATGFATGQAGLFGASNTFIYIAIRRGPMKVPTDATKVFSPNVYTPASPQTVTTNFPVDLTITTDINRNIFGSTPVFDRLRGGSTTANARLNTSSTGAEQTTGSYGIGFDNNQAIIDNFMGTYEGISEPVVYWNFSRRSGFFDEVCYTGNATIGNNQSHNLTVAPELIIIKSRSASWSWDVCHSFTSTTFGVMYLDTTNSSTLKSYGSDLLTAQPTSTNFILGNNNSANASGGYYVAYLFATCAGVSKVGSYTGNGTTQAIACGFTGGARFVLIKRTDATGDWYVYDTARGMTTLTDPYLLLNSTAAAAATLGSVTTTTGGFTVNAAILAAINTSSATYIFLAIA